MRGNSGMHVGQVLGTVLETRLRFALLPLQFVQPIDRGGQKSTVVDDGDDLLDLPRRFYD